MSVWDTKRAAEMLAREHPRLGEWIAVLRLPGSIVPTPFGRPGHHYAEAEAEALLACVIDVVEVRR